MSSEGRLRWRYYAASAAELARRVRIPVSALVLVFVLGTLGYYGLGRAHGRPWTLLDCAYMTSITLTTVGYGDVLGAGELVAGRLYTMALAVVGLGTTLYSLSALTAFTVEGHLKRTFEEKRMEDRIRDLTGHTIICGVGLTGSTVAAEHRVEGRAFVLLDQDEERIRRVAAELDGALYLVGDATSEEVLKNAGLERAGCVVATLGDDKANMFLVVTARFAHKGLRIVTSCHEHDHAPKFRAAGADHVVSTNYIGGIRIASHVLQPTVVDFFDAVRGDEFAGRLTEVVIAHGSNLVGRTLTDASLHDDLKVLALRQPGQQRFEYAPSGQTRLQAGTILVLIGGAERVEELRLRTQGPA